jgi:flagellar L-ring protein precursor FlgH
MMIRQHLFAACLAGAPLLAHAQSKAPAGRGAPPRDTSTTARPGRQSWTSDRITFGVGDVVTILIDERTLASAHLTDNHADKRTKDLGLDVAPPAGAVPISGTVSFDKDGKSRRSGEATRQNAFVAEMSARVVAVSPSGTLQVQGRKLVNVDKSKQEVVITGWIRSQDISAATNTVASSRLADAEITYVQQGGLGKPKGSILGKLIGAIWP